MSNTNSFCGKAQTEKLFKIAVPAMAINFLIYGLNSVYASYMPMYLGKYFTPAQKGLLLSIGSIVMIFSSFWGVISDRAKYKNTVLAGVIALSAVCFCLVPLNRNFLYAALMIFLIMVFMSPFVGLLDNITLEIRTEHNLSYGMLRIFGTLGFGVVALITSIFSGYSITFMFFVYLTVAAIAALMVMLSPKVEGHAYREKKKKVSSLPIFKDKTAVLMMIINSMLMICFVFYQNYMPNYMTETLGFPDWVWGVNVLLTVTLEMPFFLLFDKIMEKIGIKWVLIVCIIMSVIRYIALGTVTSVVGLFIIAAATGSWITATTYCWCYYIDRTVSAEVRASSVTLMYAVTSGIPKTISGLGGGILTGRFGFKTVIFFASAVCAVMIIPALMLPSKQKINEKIANCNGKLQ